MNVSIRLAPLLHAYTGGQAVVPARGATVGEALADLDARYPGIRFRVVDEQERMRRHMRCFVNDDDVRDVETAVKEGDVIFIVGALSGG